MRHIAPFRSYFVVVAVLFGAAGLVLFVVVDFLCLWCFFCVVVAGLGSVVVCAASADPIIRDVPTIKLVRIFISSPFWMERIDRSHPIGRGGGLTGA